MHYKKILIYLAPISYILGACGLILVIRAIIMEGIYADAYQGGGPISGSAILLGLACTILLILSVKLFSLAFNNCYAHKSSSTGSVIKQRMILGISFSIVALYVYFAAPVAIGYGISALISSRREKNVMANRLVLAMSLLAIGAPIVSAFLVFAIH